MLLHYSYFKWLLQWSNGLYSAITYSYWASFHDTYMCLRHAHYWYQLQLPYKSHRTYLTNHMGSISHHIMPLVINSLGGGHTHMQTHTHTQTHIHTDIRGQKALCIFYFLHFRYNFHVYLASMQIFYLPYTYKFSRHSRSTGLPKNFHPQI